MSHRKELIALIKNDSLRYRALFAAASLKLNDWCIAAGFVRNMVWDKTHCFNKPTVLEDIDLIYYDSGNTQQEYDIEIENRIKAIFPYNWSVKNQARMHLRNNDSPYMSTEDAMSYWPEEETAVGVTLNSNNEIEIIAPFGVDQLWANTITLNIKRPRIDDFKKRVKEKRWMDIWPGLRVAGSTLL